METEQRELDAFVMLHGQRLRNVQSATRCAYLVHSNANGIPLDVELTPYGIADILETFKTPHVTVHWLLKQVHTHDTHTSNVLGLIFGDRVLAHVVRSGTSIEDND